jgi:hypothetical protein
MNETPKYSVKKPFKYMCKNETYCVECKHKLKIVKKLSLFIILIQKIIFSIFFMYQRRLILAELY